MTKVDNAAHMWQERKHGKKGWHSFQKGDGKAHQTDAANLGAQAHVAQTRLVSKTTKPLMANTLPLLFLRKFIRKLLMHIMIVLILVLLRLGKSHTMFGGISLIMEVLSQMIIGLDRPLIGTTTNTAILSCLPVTSWSRLYMTQTA